MLWLAALFVVVWLWWLARGRRALESQTPSDYADLEQEDEANLERDGMAELSQPRVERATRSLQRIEADRAGDEPQAPEAVADEPRARDVVAAPGAPDVIQTQRQDQGSKGEPPSHAERIEMAPLDELPPLTPLPPLEPLAPLEKFSGEP